MDALFKQFILTGVECEKTPRNLEIFEQALQDLDTCIENSEVIFTLKKAIRDIKKGEKIFGQPQ